MAGIVLRDRNGAIVEYPGVERVKLNTVGGESVEFVDSAVIPAVLEDLPIALDFSNGNQTIAAPDGMVVKSAIIQKPENLIPENIPEGLDIAGIIGTMAAGGGAKVTGGSFVGTGKDDVITHNLGVVPDLVFVGTAARWTQTTIQRFAMSISLSRALATRLGWEYAGLRSAHWKASASSSYFQVDTSNGMSVAHDETFGAYSNSHITEANETTFKIYINRTMPDKTYYWIAIGGLT